MIGNRDGRAHRRRPSRLNVRAGEVRASKSAGSSEPRRTAISAAPPGRRGRGGAAATAWRCALASASSPCLAAMSASCSSAVLVVRA